jgi:hypothetical protein
LSATSEASTVAHLGELRVTAPERVFEQPEVVRPTRLIFGKHILLVGYNWNQLHTSEGDILEVGLIWRASATPTEDVSAFVHLESLAGKLVAQHDSVPAEWSRPTPGWLPGEYVVDLHSIRIPAEARPGTYRLYAGLAERTTGQRLPVAQEVSSDNRAYLGQLAVAP